MQNSSLSIKLIRLLLTSPSFLILYDYMNHCLQCQLSCTKPSIEIMVAQKKKNRTKQKVEMSTQ